MNGAKLISGDMLGMNFKNIEVNGKFYTLFPPTIEKIAGAAYYLSDFVDFKEGSDLIRAMKNMKSASMALSWFVTEDESLAEEFSKGTIGDITNGIEAALSMIDIENFRKLSVLAGNVARLTAKPKL